VPFTDDKKGVFKVYRHKNALRLIMRGERKNFRLYVAIFAANSPGVAYWWRVYSITFLHIKSPAES